MNTSMSASLTNNAIKVCCLTSVSVVKSRSVKWAWNVARMGEMRNAYKILVEKSEGKRPLGRTRKMLE
jgi:hypothetical protein